MNISETYLRYGILGARPSAGPRPCSDVRSVTSRARQATLAVMAAEL
jgi:hypothetical protein